MIRGFVPHCRSYNKLNCSLLIANLIREIRSLRRSRHSKASTALEARRGISEKSKRIPDRKRHDYQVFDIADLRLKRQFSSSCPIGVSHLPESASSKKAS